MARHRPARELARIVQLRNAERHATRMELHLATEREQEAVRALEEAQAEVGSAATEWHTHVAGPFAPELATGLAAELMQRVAAGRAAEGRRDLAVRQRDELEREWQACEARHRVAETLLAASRRSEARDRAERVLDRVADRVTLSWRLA